MKKLMNILITLLLCMLMVLPVAAQAAHPSRLIDEADLLTDIEEGELLSLLNELSEEFSFDIVIVTVNSLDGKSSQAYADDYYDYKGYGMGENYDGALFLVSMEERQWHISISGYGISAINDNDLYRMEEEIVPYLSSGEYAEAFENFAWLCAGSVKEAVAAGVASVDVEEEINWGTWLISSLILGFVLAFIPMRGMKRKMKSVVARAEAADYLKRGSRKITRSRDAFLYHTINRVYTPKQEHSSTHTGSSGRSHGGSGGAF